MISFEREREYDQDQNPSATFPTVYDVLCFHFRKCSQGAKVIISRTNHTLKHEILHIKTLTTMAVIPIVHLSCNLSMQSVFTIEPKQLKLIFVLGWVMKILHSLMNSGKIKVPQPQASGLLESLQQI